jgi:cysteine desulfurase family protein (TIGR01976 family)
MFFMTFDIAGVRAQFPALNQVINGRTPIYFDNPAGTQVPQRVIDAVVDYFSRINANQGGAFSTSHATDVMVHEAREIMADFLNAPSSEQIVFGPNSTTLNFAFSRALAQTLPADAEIVVTRMDHDANVSPWLTVARDRNLPVKWVNFDAETGTLDMDSLEMAITPKTRIVAAVHASNALGTVNPVKQIADAAHSVGAVFVMDAVQSAPHVPIDVQQIGCDVLLCSAYKFFGPHIGIMYARYDLLADLPAYKVRPSKDVPPYRWETGTPSFETIAATAEAVRYIESLASDRPVAGYEGRRLRLKQAMLNLQDYETTLAKHLIDGLQAIPGVVIAGITDEDKYDQRVPTVILVKDGHTPLQIAQCLAEHDIYVWDGNYYAVEVMARLGRTDTGMVRVGPVHYNTIEEIDKLLNVLNDM